MSDGSIVKDGSEEAREALRSFLARGDVPTAQLLEDELDAFAFANQCEREWAAKEREEALELEQKQRCDWIELLATEALELGTSVGSGALASWKTSRGVRIGETINGIAGGVAKLVCLTNPQNRAVRVAGRAAKVMLHSQLAMMTKTKIES